MTVYTYKVVPAPSKGRKAPGVKSPEARFAHAIETAINEMAAEGWDYIRADILPSEERQGLTSTQTVYRTVLVFRRSVSAQDGPMPAEEIAQTAAETLSDPDAEAEAIAAQTLPGFRRRTPPPVTGESGARPGSVAPGPRLSADVSTPENEAPADTDETPDTQAPQTAQAESPEDGADQVHRDRPEDSLDDTGETRRP